MKLAKDLVNWPKIIIVAYYHCNECPNPHKVIYASKAEVPSKHPEHGTDLIAVSEVIETLLWMTDEEGKENESEESLPDQADKTCK